MAAPDIPRLFRLVEVVAAVGVSTLLAVGLAILASKLFGEPRAEVLDDQRDQVADEDGIA